MFDHHSRPRLTLLFSPYALGPETISANSRSSLHHVQLLPSGSSAQHCRFPGCGRQRLGTDTALVRFLRHRLRRNARTPASSHQRAGARHTPGRPADVQATRVAKAAQASQHAVLAAAILRFQRLERAQAPGKAAISAPQSGGARIRRLARGLGVEQLSSLSDRRGWGRRDRVTMDRTKT